MFPELERNGSSCSLPNHLLLQQYAENLYTPLQDQWKGGEILPPDPVQKSSWSFQWDWLYPQEKKQWKTKPKRTEAVIQKVKSFFQETPSCSLRKASQQISPTTTTLWRIVRHDLRFRFYNYTSVQPLTNAHKAQKKHFCQWILQQPSNIVDRIIWTDENFFCLHKNLIEKTTECGQMKILEISAKQKIGMMLKKWMLFVAIINGMVLVVLAFLNDDGHLSSVNGASYLRLLQDIIWPRLLHSAKRSSRWWMQDGLRW